MPNERELDELCKYIVTKGKELGATHVEARAQSGVELETEVELGQVSTVSNKMNEEIAIRLYVGKKMGCAFTNIPTREAADEALELAIAAANATTEDADWVGLPVKSKYPKVEELWDDSVPKSDSSDVVRIVGTLIDRASSAVEGLIPAYGASGALAYHSAYANSNEVEHSEKSTNGYVVIGGVSQTESGMTPMVVSYDIRRGLKLDLDFVVEDLATMMKLCKIPKKGKTGKHTVVIAPHAYQQIFEYTLLQSVRGDNVARGKSKIGDKIGEAIASEKITVVDDGLNPRGVNTSCADDEGVPRQKTPIIEDGILRSFLWDTYWANKMGVKSTGNARRNMRQGLVEIASTTIVVEPGEREIEEIISGIEHGYYIRGVQGAHSSNPESGDFSVVGNPAILIENGKMVGAIDGLMVSGNAFDILKQVEEVARMPFYLQGTIGPEIVFRDVDIIAKE
ncbi:MAG: TldD/PmbA family protein [Candidatus Thorarchaeota archaeon]|nr:MAG: TldD/PmbA family protein [Candidatus Thorarchaeota archaeon]